MPHEYVGMYLLELVRSLLLTFCKIYIPQFKLLIAIYA